MGGTQVVPAFILLVRFRQRLQTTDGRGTQVVPAFILLGSLLQGSALDSVRWHASRAGLYIVGAANNHQLMLMLGAWHASRAGLYIVGR